MIRYWLSVRNKWYASDPLDKNNKDKILTFLEKISGKFDDEIETEGNLQTS